MSDKEIDSVFSLHYFEEIDWEGTDTRFIGTFRSISDAIKGFSTWIERAATYRIMKVQDILLRGLQGLETVEQVNALLDTYHRALGCDDAAIEIKEHKLGEVILP